MTKEQFQEVLENKIQKICNLAETKAGHYATQSDRLHNFKRAGRVLDVTPERALLGFVTKQFVSILDNIDRIDKNFWVNPAEIEERIDDTITYLILLQALFDERYGSAKVITTKLQVILNKKTKKRNKK